MRLINQHLIALSPLTFLFVWGLTIEHSIPSAPEVNSHPGSHQNEPLEEVISLSQEHIDAVNRRRRIVLQYDPSELGTDFQAWIAKRFKFMDKPGNQIDALWWDIGGANTAPYPSRVGDRYEHPGIKKWWDQGIDWVEELVKETRKRNLEVFWNYRMAEVELRVGSNNHENAVKKAHPDWVLKSWYDQGLWNYAVPKVRQYRLEFIQELLEKYQFDGIQLDFARHVPILPVGRQWELRENVTEFVRMVRLMMLEMEKKLGRPILLSVKVPRNMEGCRVDGFDVETWARLNLVDFFVMGARSVDVDINAYRQITTGRNIKLFPCWDDYHSSDAYRGAPPEFLRGLFGNWWQQGADGVVIFNWWVDEDSDYDVKRYLTMDNEGGSRETLRFKDKMFMVERRGGYPWAEGYHGRNDTAPLPFTLANDGRPGVFHIRISDHIGSYADRIDRVTMRLVIFGAKEGDKIGAKLNGVKLVQNNEDFDWKDPQIFSPRPQPNSGSALPADLSVAPDQQLLRLEYELNPRLGRVGQNQIEVSIEHREPYGYGSSIHNIVLEKLEIHLDYK